MDLSTVTKFLKNNSLLLIIIFVSLGLFMVMGSYSAEKAIISDNFTAAATAGSTPPPQQEGPTSQKFNDVGDAASAPAAAYSTRPANQASDLLPLPGDQNAQWANVNPMGVGDLANVNLLNAGYFNGIDTIGQTLKNPNLQLRSEPIIAKKDVGPWNQSTIESDYMRTPFEIGSGGSSA